MSYAEREAIFSKEYLTIKDFEVLFGLSYQMASRKIREIKFKFDRLKVEGRIHTEDYFDYYNITDKQRYVKGEQENV